MSAPTVVNPGDAKTSSPSPPSAGTSLLSGEEKTGDFVVERLGLLDE